MENRAFENPSSQLADAASLSEDLSATMTQSLSDTLLPDYVDALGLEGDPFGFELAESSGVYLGGGRREAFEQVVHLSEFGAGALVISARAGGGKSTLFHALADEQRDTWTICSVEAKQCSCAEKLFSLLASSLAADVSDGASSGELLVSIRHELTQGSLTPILLLIDDAHLLDDSVLSALLSLLQSPSDTDLPLQLVLFGDPQLIYRLDSFSLVDILLHDIALENLTRDEVESYLVAKFRAVGWSQPLPFDRDEVDRLFGLSAGDLGQLHESARQILLDRVTVDHDRLDRGLGLPVGHMFSLVLLLGILIMAYFYKDSWFDVVDAGPDLVTASSDEGASAKALAFVEPTKSVEQVKVGAREQADEAEPAASLVPEYPRLEALTSSVGDDGQSGAHGVIEEQMVAASDFPVRTTMPIDRPKLDFSVSNEPSLLESELADVKPSPATLPPPAVSGRLETVMPELVERRPLLSEDERLLMALDPRNFVLQVMAAGTKSSVELFVSAQVNRSELQLFTTWRQGKPWYVVVTGDYSSSSEARQEVRSLPQIQKKAGPWPRPVSDIHTKIKDFRRI